VACPEAGVARISDPTKRADINENEYHSWQRNIKIPGKDSC